MHEPPTYAAIAFPLIAAVLICTAALCLRVSPFYRGIIEVEEVSDRFHAIDGLRGLLAIGVFLHHSVITYYFYKTGTWTVPPSRLSTLFGQGGVAFFFMITAFLFWGRSDMGGQGAVPRFYWSRMRRLCPMFFVSATLVVLVAIALTHFRIRVPVKDLGAQILSWMAFTFPGTPDINGLPNTSLINGAFWTLIYEWRFYFVLPFLLLFRGRWLFICAVGLVAVWLYLLAPDTPTWYFLYGVIAATLTCEAPLLLKHRASTPLASILGVACLLLAYATQSSAYNPIAPLLLFLPFLVIANGNTMFGLLVCRPVRVLGLISYSIYLLHSMFLYLGFRLVAHSNSIIHLSPLAFWLIVCSIGLATVAVSTVTYQRVEHYFARQRMPALSVDG
jgi:peptidoglycan/LPS O-acetylase OafA/YrhL